MKVVRVRWQDSVTIVGWLSQEKLDEWSKDGPAIIESVGYLFKKSKRCVVLIQSIHPYEKREDLGEPLMIPTKSVISLDVLKDYEIGG